MCLPYREVVFPLHTFPVSYLHENYIDLDTICADFCPTDGELSLHARDNETESLLGGCFAHEPLRALLEVVEEVIHRVTLCALQDTMSEHGRKYVPTSCSISAGVNLGGGEASDTSPVDLCALFDGLFPYLMYVLDCNGRERGKSFMRM